MALKNLYSINDSKFIVISAGTGTGCVGYIKKNFIIWVEYLSEAGHCKVLSEFIDTNKPILMKLKSFQIKEIEKI